MAITYGEALNIVEVIGKKRSQNFVSSVEVVPITRAVGRLSQGTIRSLYATPAFDTSAMDGYAVDSRLTTQASLQSPIKFIVRGTMAAGDHPLTVFDCKDRYPTVIEIMTGAQFPVGGPEYAFDACIKVEDTTRVRDIDGRVYIEIVAPVRRNQHRRFAGSDLEKNEIVIPRHCIVQPPHIMAIAAIGIDKIAVQRRPRVAVICTGSELLPHDSRGGEEDRIRDSNGPYIKVMLEDFGVDVDYVGIVQDSIADFEMKLAKLQGLCKYDAFITTGAVSVGKFDFVRAAIEDLGANIEFHGVAMRPGSPVLFATLPERPTPSHGNRQQDKEGTAFFGLPGNPMATAVCLRFLVMPYLRHLQAQPPEVPNVASIKGNTLINISNCAMKQSIICTYPPHVDNFRHARMSNSERGTEVELNGDQGPSKMSPWLTANCWALLPCGKGKIVQGDMLQCYPMKPE